MSDDHIPAILDLPVGLAGAGDTDGTRIEADSMGQVAVPAGHYWGAQTQRSLEHFAIGDDRMPLAVAHAYGHVKKAAAIVNVERGALPAWMGEVIGRVCDEIVAGALDDEFPLSVWQTGSGTQTNMNVNEVIANRAIQLVGGVVGSKAPVHPNDHVNMAQSSNDTFPTAMHVATALALVRHTVPAVERLRDAMAAKAEEWADVVKIGRTHLQDATPLTVGQEWSGHVAQLDGALDTIAAALPGLHRLAMGGTAVGTGLNAPDGWAVRVTSVIAGLTREPFTAAPNPFAALAGVDDMVRASAALRGLALVLTKVANDIRWLGSGPRAGLHELVLPANEPGSSIMPGKVNPTQCEAMLMVCQHVVGLDAAVAMAGASGNFQLNTFRPVVVHDVLSQARLLGDACDHFRRFLVEGLALDEARIADHVARSVMLVTALAPTIGYDAAAAIAHDAVTNDLTLREAALASGHVTAEDFDRIVVPRDLT